MKVNDFIQAYVPPTSSGIFLVFIIRDSNGRIVGEYDPMVQGCEWECNNKENIMQQRVFQNYLIGPCRSLTLTPGWMSFINTEALS